MFDLKKFGVTDQYLNSNVLSDKVSSSGKLLLYDGDGACYTSCTVAKVSTALRRLEEDIYTKMFLAGCSKAWVHLTPRGCKKNGRDALKTVKPYQGNRKNVKKPPLLEPLRSQALRHFEGHPDITVYHNFDVEADDALIIDHYMHPDAVLISPDKDLNVTPFAQYILDAGRTVALPTGDRYGYLEYKEWLTPAGSKSTKVTGKGTKFFWAQMLMGDTADNVKGIIKYKDALCGTASTYNILKDVDNEPQCANLVLDGYREIGQNAVAEGAAMWLLRNPTDDVIQYFKECELTPLNLEFILECAEDYRHEH